MLMEHPIAAIVAEILQVMGSCSATGAEILGDFVGSFFRFLRSKHPKQPKEDKTNACYEEQEQAL